MKGTSDFVELLGPDLSMKIMMCLEDPSDLVRVSAVSILWRQFGEFDRLCYCLCAHYTFSLAFYKFI